MTSWRDDRLLPGYQCTDLPLPGAVTLPGEPGEVVATLVRRNPPRHRRALLYVHGWSDYFFQAHLADRMDALGFDVHALDLRRFGRSLRPGQVPGYSTDLDEYAAELDAALAVLRADHDSVTVMAHSLGGLVASLWADRRPGQLDGLVLNAPWLDLQGSALLRAVAAPVVTRLGTFAPTRVLPIPNNGLYGRSIDAALDGEWTWEAELKNAPGFAIRAGWLAAVLAGHDRVRRGLDIDTPVLVLASTRSDFRRQWDEALKSADAVLDVERIVQAAPRLGRHVTVVRITDGLHDLALSAEPVREVFFDEVARWVRGYVR